nr:ribonuclease E [Chroomonas collegionis]
MLSIKCNQLVISEKTQLAALYNENKLIELKTYYSKYQIGDIYLGKLDNSLYNINAAFIKLHSIEKNGFIQLNNLIPTKLNQHLNIKYEQLKFNELVLVQIIKEPSGTKGPSLTTNLGLIGDYLILLPFGEGVSISKKIYPTNEKQYLKAFIQLLKPMGIGILVKKEASEIQEELLKKDFVILLNKWYEIQSKVRKTFEPALLSTKVDFVEDTVKTFYNTNVTKISIDSLLGSWKVYNQLITWGETKKNKDIKIEYYYNFPALLTKFHLDLTIYSLLQAQLSLTNGGSIVIEKTEALTSIDINSSSFNHLLNSRTTLLWINCEAASEIARQLKLRNIGGIVVIDFIDMRYQKDQMTLLNHFNKILSKDKGYPKIIQLSEIGLIELTRKREGQNVYDVFSSKCSKCNGLGHHVRFSCLNSLSPFVNSFELYCNYSLDFS